MLISNIGNDKFEDLFTKAFEPIAQEYNIGEYSCVCKREEVGGNGVKIEVMIVGLCGSPFLEDFVGGKDREKTIKNANLISMVDTNRDETKLSFKLMKDECINLNSTDYILVYSIVA